MPADTAALATSSTLGRIAFAIVQIAQGANPLPDTTDFAGAPLALAGTHVAVELDDLAHALPRVLAIAESVLVAQHVVAQLADGDPRLGEGVGIVHVQTGLRRELLERSRDQGSDLCCAGARSAEANAQVEIGRGEQNQSSKEATISRQEESESSSDGTAKGDACGRGALKDESCSVEWERSLALVSVMDSWTRRGQQRSNIPILCAGNILATLDLANSTAPELVKFRRFEALAALLADRSL